jgi:SAM-dependent methyltransferase
MSLIDQVAPRLRDCWMRFALRRVHYTDRVDRLDRLYLVKDPWYLQSPKEQARFAWTNRVIAEHFGRPETILEIGCGEGHQSQRLARVCGQLYGIDVSRRAVRRARRRCPEARFIAAADPLSFHFDDMALPADLVVACEMLYYVKDVPRFIERISTLGQACLVTYYQAQAASLDPYFAGRLGCRRAQFRCDNAEWCAVWWRNDEK